MKYILYPGKAFLHVVSRNVTECPQGRTEMTYVPKCKPCLENEEKILQPLPIFLLTGSAGHSHRSPVRSSQLGMAHTEGPLFSSATFAATPQSSC